MTIRIDEEFRALIPVLAQSELEILETSLLVDGCRDALAVWNDILLDGHNRYYICEANNINYNAREIQGIESRDDAKLWIIHNQLGRRNLTNYQRAELALLLKPLMAEMARKKLATHTDQGYQKSDKAVDTTKELAKAVGVSRDTIHRAGVIAEKATDEVKEQLRAGDTSINCEYKKIMDKPHISQNSGNNEWYTPSKFIDAARETMGGIDLDPASCAVANEIVCADKFYTIDDNGLEEPWSGRVWLNPPYSGTLVREFAEKILLEIPNCEQIVVLVNNATETGWFQSLLREAKSVCFLEGRVKFLGEDKEPKNTPLQGQAVLYFGDNSDGFTHSFSELGQVFVHA